MLFPLVIPYKNLLVEKEHVKGFEEEVFFVEGAGGEATGGETVHPADLRDSDLSDVFPMGAELPGHAHSRHSNRAPSTGTRPKPRALSSEGGSSSG